MFSAGADDHLSSEVRNPGDASCQIYQHAVCPVVANSLRAASLPAQPGWAPLVSKTRQNKPLI